MKREIPLLLVFIAGAFMIVQYFVPAEISERAYEFLLDWTIIIGIFALALGIWSLVRVSIHKIRNRHPDAKYAMVTIAGLVAMILFGFQFPGVEYKSDRDVAKVNQFIRGQLGDVKSQGEALVNLYPPDLAQADSIYGLMTAAADSAQYWISHLQHSKWVIRSQSDTAAIEQLQAAVGNLKQEMARFDRTGTDSALWVASLSDIQTLSDSALALSAGVSNVKDDYPFIGGLASYLFRAFFDHVMIPIQSTMFSLLAFYIASAAYRAFRARNLLSSVLLLAAFILMLRVIPLGPVSQLVTDVSNWILLVPNLAAKRAIWIGVGLGIVATALKVVLGIERSYMGKD